jgi:hypothetical protein
MSSEGRAPAVFPLDPCDRLEATVAVLHDIAEANLDTQATRTDPAQEQWLRGYRQACKDTLDAADLYRKVLPHA